MDSNTASQITNMKELRPPSTGRSEIRILFVFDPWRSAILLLAGDKSGQWSRWYREAIPEAEKAAMLAELVRVADMELGAGRWWLDSIRRMIPEHPHWHARSSWW